MMQRAGKHCIKVEEFEFIRLKAFCDRLRWV